MERVGFAKRFGTALVALSLCSMAACGSTVQQRAQSQTNAFDGDGLTTGSLSEAAGGPGTAPKGSAGPVRGGSDAPDIQPGSSASVGGGRSDPGTGVVPKTDAINKAPLRLGLIYGENDAAAAAGVSTGINVGPRSIFEALVKATNQRGGLAGRLIKPTYFGLKATSQSYASDMEAGCQAFVRDAKVSVVMSILGFTDEQFEACLAKAGVAHISASYALGDETSIARAPGLVATQALSVDRRFTALLQRAVASGHLTRSSRIGVVVDECPYNQRAWQKTVQPTAKRLGLNIVTSYATQCVAGINDLGPLTSDAASAELQFVSNRVDRIFVVSAEESTVLLYLMQAAESQGYRPGYALTSVAIANVLKDNVPHEQLLQAKGVGWLPTWDDTGPLTPTAPTQSCVKTMRDQGLQPSTATDHNFMFSACDAFGLAQAALTGSRGSTAPTRWSAALDSVGTAFRGASMLDGRTSFAQGRRDGPAAGRIFTWMPPCECFKYVGPTFAL